MSELSTHLNQLYYTTSSTERSEGKITTCKQDRSSTLGNTSSKIRAFLVTKGMRKNYIRAEIERDKNQHSKQYVKACKLRIRLVLQNTHGEQQGKKKSTDACQEKRKRVSVRRTNHFKRKYEIQCFCSSITRDILLAKQAMLISKQVDVSLARAQYIIQ